MGVPALFRWLQNKYPKIISPVIEEQPQEIEGQVMPVDTTGPNPNGEEFDNLYLDMNGIVHPCSHPEDRPPPATEEDMMLEVFKYTERVVNMVRPRKLLMIAVDGVAPRAKMNQQRSRRFRSAQERKEKDEEKAEFLKLLKSQGKGPADEDAHAEMTKKTWDTNAITPGTPFMDILAASLRYWVAYKLNTDPAWEKLKIIISDATVPGEGEHKIMNFIRSQRRSQEHDPNTRHVIYGLDADLIMLGLATHEPHFRVLREDVFFQESKARTCKLCGQTGHKAEECRGEVKKKAGEFDEKHTATPLKPFIWLHVSVLREYLAAELDVRNQGFTFDLERAIDDWIFMCFFVGNDFLPHLPSLEIRENGIDTLIAIWRDNIPAMGGYVTKDGHVDLARAQYILSGLAKQEAAIFKRRQQVEERREAGNKRRKTEAGNRKAARYSAGSEGSGFGDPNTPLQGRKGSRRPPGESYDSLPAFSLKEANSREVRQMTHDMVVNRKAIYQANMANKSAAAALKAQLLGQNTPENQTTSEAPESTELAVNGGSAPGTPTSTNTQTPPSALGKRKAELLEDDSGTPGRSTPDSAATPQADSDEPPPDTVRLWEEGYADRYYEQKFHADPKDIEFRHRVARDYVEGLCWVLLYYFQGCPSWTWYYPHHYAPFAEDFVDLDKLKISFDKGTPFRPYEQLMGVMPAASSHVLPEPFRGLMTDEDSDILDFYPEDFVVDLNGKKMAWQGVALLPFIDEKRLLKAMARKYPLLTAEENARNGVGKDVLLFSTKHPLYEEIALNFYSKKQGAPKYKLNSKISEGLTGKIEKNESYLPQSSLDYPLPSGGMPDLDDDQSISVNYEMPYSPHIHKSMLLRGVKFPPPALDHSEIEATRSRASRTGRSFGGVPFRNGDNNFRSGPGRYENGVYDDGAPKRFDRGNRREDSGGRGGGANGGSAPGGLNYANPFAAHLNPNFDPNSLGRAPPPPHLVAQSGWVPPPPPPGQYGYGGPPPLTVPPMAGGGYGYGYPPPLQGGQGRGYGGPPPPGQQGRGGYGGQGRRDGYGSASGGRGYDRY